MKTVSYSRARTGLWMMSGLSLCCAISAWAQSNALPAPTAIPTRGAPGPLRGLDSAFAGMGRLALGSLSWWMVLFLGLALAYVLGLITHTIAFALGASGAAASRVGAWVTGLLLCPLLIAILPGIWPRWTWWTPYLIVTAIIIGLCLLPKPTYR